MLSKLSRNWWVFALQGLLTVVFGVLTLVWPQSALEALVITFGVFALLEGILVLIAGIRARWMALAVSGLVGIAVGVLTLVWPNITGRVLLYLIAAWAVITGILEIVAAVDLRRLVDDEWLMILGGIFSVVFGVLVMIFPGAGALSIAWLIGIYAILAGITLIVFAVRSRRWLERVDKAAKQIFQA